MTKERYILAGAQILLLACFLLFGAGATNYYVEKTGSNDIDVNGSITNPWQTVGHALDKAAPWDTINIGAGEFRETIIITNPVILNGQNTYSAGKPPLGRHSSITEIRAPSTNLGGRIITVETNDVTIQNLTLYGDPYTNGIGSVLQGIRTAHRPLTVSNCKIANFSGRGIECRGDLPLAVSTDGGSLRSYFGYNLITNISSSSNYTDGILLEKTQATVEHNEISGINGPTAHAGIYVSRCYYTSAMGTPVTIRSNFLNDCKQAIWGNDPVSQGETFDVIDNTITNSLIGIRVAVASGPARIIGNSVHVTGISAIGTPARGIWIQADSNPWSTTQATDHAIMNNTLISEAVTNDQTVGMLFTYTTTPSGSQNNGVRATVLTNYVYNFAIGSMVESGSNGVAISNTPLVEVVYHHNDIYGSVTSAIMTTGFSYIVDATTNFLGYADPSNMVSTNVNYTDWTMGSWSLDTDGDLTNDWADLDDDGDGWSDINEAAAGASHPNRFDSDGDGMNDPDEYFTAGTDPMDPASVLALKQLSWVATNSVAFEWPSVAGKTYYVYSTTNLTTGFGSAITNFTASAPTNYYTNYTATWPTYFYQISVSN